MLQLAKYLRWLYELSFSIYCALLIVVEEGVKENPVVFFRLAYPILFVYGFLADVLHWAHFSPSVYRHMVALWWSMWCVLAAIIFVCLHLVRRVAPTRTALRYVGGFVAVSGFPLIWLRFGTMTGCSLATTRWLLLEILAILSFAFFDLHRNRPIYPGFGVLVLGLHFGIWYFATRGDRTLGDPLVYLLLGTCTSLLWRWDIARRCPGVEAIAARH